MQTKTYRTFFIILTVITALGSVGWLANTYLYSDDFPYATETLDEDISTPWDCYGARITSVDQLWDSFINHYNHVNGRISNWIEMAWLLMPRPLGGALLGLLIAVWYMVIISVCRPRGSGYNFKYLFMGVALLWLAFPWYNNFQSFAYQLNYIPACILGLTMYMQWRRLDSPSVWPVVWGSVAAFFTPWMHEGFFFSLLGMLLHDAILNKGNRRRQAIVLVAFALGFVVTMSRGTFIRIDATPRIKEISDIANLQYIITRYISQMWPLWLAFGLLLFARLRRPREQWRSTCNTVLPWLLGSCIALGQAMVVYGIHRVLWPAHLCSVIAVLKLMHILWPTGDARRGAVIAAAVAAAFYAVWFSGVVYWQCIIKNEQIELNVKAAETLPKGIFVLYSDLSFDEIPWWTLRLASNDDYREYFFNDVFSSFYHRRDRGPHQFVAILPADFEGKHFSEWPKIPGDNDLRGRWPLLVGEGSHGKVINHEFLDFFEMHYNVTVGEPKASVAPMDYPLMREPITTDTYFNYAPIVIEDTVRYYYFFGTQGRKLDHRELIRIDPLTD